MEPGDKEKIATFDYSRLSKSFTVLSKPAQRALANNGIYTVKALAKWRRADLHGIGPASFPNLEKILRAEGLEFRK